MLQQTVEQGVDLEAARWQARSISPPPTGCT